MEYQTVTDVDNELREIEKRQKELKIQREKMLKDEITRSPIGEMASLLHDQFCNSNHTDQCSWHYEIKDGVHDWTQFAHASWLKRAESITEKISHLDLEKLFADYKEVKDAVGNTRIY